MFVRRSGAYPYLLSLLWAPFIFRTPSCLKPSLTLSRPNRYAGSHPLTLIAAQNFSYTSNPTPAVILAYTLSSLDWEFLKDENCEFVSPALTVVRIENWHLDGTQTEKTTQICLYHALFSSSFPGESFGERSSNKRNRGKSEHPWVYSQHTCCKR